MKMKTDINVLRIAGCLACWLLFGAPATAQHWDGNILVGYNIGGSTPTPMPAEIRSINYAPDLWSPNVGVEVVCWLNDKWGIAMQVACEHKGFAVDSRVKSLYTEIIMNDGSVQSGNFTGENSTRINNTWLTAPLKVVYSASERWSSYAGVYIAYLLRPQFTGAASDGYMRRGAPTGEKVEVVDATFDFSDSQNRFDYGLLLAERWHLNGKMALVGQLSYGLRPLFPDSFSAMPFKMYNIYGTLGLCYKAFSR
ncbi:MAG: PorT family protein [Bacteroidales bacterium]|jgi:hypothetical protein|nr:PorT family protein [Bacteroidales bacterium]